MQTAKYINDDFNAYAIIFNSLSDEIAKSLLVAKISTVVYVCLFHFIALFVLVVLLFEGCVYGLFGFDD